MRHIIYSLFALLFVFSCSVKYETSVERVQKIIASLHDPKAKNVLVVCHRGDWRNFPENSVPAIESVIKMGADIVELDVKMTKDSVLVLCHDWTVDRMTNGKGPVSTYTLDSLKRLRLKRAHGVVTDSIHIPTLEEAFAICKDRIVVNVDHGYGHYDKVLEVAERVGVVEQVLIKGKSPLDEVRAKLAGHPRNLMYMPIIDILKPAGKTLFESYMAEGEVPIAYEVCWNKMTPEVEACMKQVVSSGSKLWVNTIWGSLCGGIDDDLAYVSGNPDEVYGLMVGLGATIIQTDRPEFLLSWLRANKLHD